MAFDKTLIETQFTPRRNPKRTCSRQEPWKFDDDDECTFRDINDDDVDFKARCSTPSYTNLTSPSTSRSSPGSRPSVPRSRNTSSRVWNKFTDEYDPDNDVFIHDVIKVKFDTVKLKSHIQQLMKGTGIPPYKRAINKCIKQQYQAAKMRHANRMKYAKKRTPRKVESDTDLDDDTPSTPTYARKCTPESTLRAMIYTRDFLKRMASKRKKAEEEAAAAAAARKLRGDTPKVAESEILKGVVAFVDVISHEDEDISSVVGKELEKLGAVVVPTLTKNDPVSIILFNDGHVSTYQKAKKRGIPLVSVLWIEECRNSGTRAPTSQFPPSKMERYESPACLKELKKRKFVYGTERMIPRKQRKRARKNESTAFESPTGSQNINPCEMTPKREPSAPEWLNRIQGANGMMKILVNMTGIAEDEFHQMMEEPNDSEKYEASPLPVRLLHKLARDLSCNRTSSGNESSKCDKLGHDSNKNVQSDTSSILATAVTEESFLPPKDKKLETPDGGIDVTPRNMTEENLNPMLIRRRVSTRLRSVRRMLSY